MLVKNIGKIIFGSASPTQLILACAFGGMLGFMPGFPQAAGSIVALTVLLFIFNCNLGLAALVGLGAKLLSLALMPVTFKLGGFFLDGPTQGLFADMINAPVLALFGFEYYLTTGGLFLGAILGLGFGVLLTGMVTGLRKKLAAAEAGSERFRQITESGASRLVLKLLMGGMPAQGYTAVLEQKQAPIRIAGVGVSALFVGALYGGVALFNGPYAGGLLRGALEKVNGATVDIASAALDLGNGAFTVTGLAIADPNDLSTDLFRAGTVTMDISGADLLRKRVRIDRVEIVEAVHGMKRAKPGELVGDPPEPSPTPSESNGGKTLDNYLNNAETWKQRLGQVKRWLDKTSGSGAQQATSKAKTATAQPQEESLEEWLNREIQAKGYAHVAASHLIQGSPSLQIDLLNAARVTTALFPEETLTLQARALSTEPHLVARGPGLTLTSSGGTIDLALTLDGASAQGGPNRVKLALTDLSAAGLGGQLAQKGALSGGAVDVTLDGEIQDRGGAWVDLPVGVTVKNAQIKFSGQDLPIKRLDVPIRLRGPLDNPAIIVNEKRLSDSLAKAAQGALKSKAKAMAKKKLKNKLNDKLGGKADGLLDGLGGKLFGN